MSLVTRCPQCTTMFKVVPDQIRIAGGWVRCGNCGEVFDASAHMLPYEQSLQAEVAAPQPAPVQAPEPPAPPPVSFGPAVSMARMLTHPSAAPVAPAAPEPAPPPEPPAVAPEPEHAAPPPAVALLPDPPAFAPRAEAELFKPPAPVVAPEPEAPWAEPPLDMGVPPVEPAFPADAPTMPTPVEAPWSPEPAFQPEAVAPTPADEVAEAPLVFKLDDAAVQADVANLSSGVQAPTNWPATTAFSEHALPAAPRVDAPIEAPIKAAPAEVPPSFQPAQVEVSAPLSLPSERVEGDRLLPERAVAQAAPVAFEPDLHLAARQPAARPEPADPAPVVARPRRRDETKAASRRSAGRPSVPADPPEVAAAPEPAPQVPEAELSFVKQAQRRAFWSSGPVRASLWGLAVLLLLALGVQVMLERRDWLAAREPRLLPVLQAVCKPLGCTVRPYRQLNAMVIDSSAFNRLSGNQFNFSVTLRNTGDLPVATPDLDLTLTNAQDQPLVRRVVTAAELGAPASLPPGGEFAGASTLTVAEAASPSAVIGYRLTAFYP